MSMENSNIVRDTVNSGLPECLLLHKNLLRKHTRNTKIYSTLIENSGFAELTKGKKTVACICPVSSSMELKN